MSQRVGRGWSGRQGSGDSALDGADISHPRVERFTERSHRDERRHWADTRLQAAATPALTSPPSPPASAAREDSGPKVSFQDLFPPMLPGLFLRPP